MHSGNCHSGFCRGGLYIAIQPNLERHLKTKKHKTNEVRGGKIEDFVCKDCDIVFQNDFLLKRHFLSIKHKLKINPELFKCTQKHKNKECNKLFKSNRELQNHIADHEDYSTKPPREFWIISSIITI